jgi:hypothetical protein
MMKTDLLYISVIAALLVFSLFFQFYKESRQSNSTLANRLKKILPIISVIISLLTVFITYYSYKYKMDVENQKLKILLAQNQENIEFTNITKLNALDSLNRLRVQLDKAVSNIKKQQKITGIHNDYIGLADEKIKHTEIQINEIRSYNDVSLIRYNDLSSDIDSFYKKNYMTSGSTSTFQLRCPEKSDSAYLDVSLVFNNDSIVNEIAFMFVCEVKWVGKNSQTVLFNQTYKPQPGVNKFRIKNQLNEKNSELLIGYFLKTELGKKIPFFEKITCRMTDNEFVTH